MLNRWNVTWMKSQISPNILINMYRPHNSIGLSKKFILLYCIYLCWIHDWNWFAYNATKSHQLLAWFLSNFFFFFYGSLISAFFMILKLELPFYAGCTTSSLLESSDRVHWENSDSLLPLCTVLPGTSQPPSVPSFPGASRAPFHVLS